MDDYKEIGDFDFVVLGQKEVWPLADACNAVACFEHGPQASPEKLRAFIYYLRLSVFAAGVFGEFFFCDSSGKRLSDDKAYTCNDKGRLAPNTFYCHIAKSDALNALSKLPSFDLNAFKKRLSIQSFMSKQAATKNASTRWGRREPMVKTIEDHVISLIDNGCVCDHAQVKDYAWKQFQKDDGVVKLFTKKVKASGEKDYSKFLTKDNVKDITRTVFEAKAPERIFKVTLHKRSKKCTIHFPGK